MGRPHTGTTSIDILEGMSTDPNELAEQFRTMPAQQFDAVCASAIVYMLEDQKADWFVSTGALSTVITAMRDRYRSIVKQYGGDLSPQMNELQLRIIRRVEMSRERGVTSEGTARVFGITGKTVSNIRHRGTA